MVITPYQWTRKDKFLYGFAMVPFLALFLGTIYILSTYSLFLPLAFLGFYLLTNVFQAGCCVGCPYRGKYCPAFCGVYLGNLLSARFYKNRSHEEKFFHRNAAAGETMLFLFLVFPLYWLYLTAWYFVPVYILLFAAHVLLFLPSQCAKCSYNSICPGGQAWQSCRTMFGRKER
jgi:hypothetical protein